MSTKRSVQVAGIAIIILFVLAFVEAASYLLLTGFPRLASRIYSAPAVSDADIAEFIDQRDDRLGWPTKRWLAAHADADGARLSPANAALGDRPACVSLYGDSFTFASEVDDAAAWGNVLAGTLGCPVKNYGVGGYAVDQAVLRFEANADDPAGVVLLGIFAEDLTRSRNQWRYLLDSADPFSFKPSFSRGSDGQLTLHPLPAASPDDVRRIFADPWTHLDNEHYLPGDARLPAKTTFGFPYTVSTARLAMQIVRALNWQHVSLSTSLTDWNYPHWYDTPEGVDADSIALNTSLVARFAAGCAARGKRCAVVIMPGKDTLKTMAENDRHLMREIIEPLRPHIDLWDPTAAFVEAAGDGSVCDFVGQDRDCNGHYNADGYRLLATFVAQQIEAAGLLK